MKFITSCSAILLALVLVSTSTRAQQPKLGHETDDIGGKVDFTKFLADAAPGTTVQHEMLPMRDGVKLATDAFVPPGAGPFPVVLSRGYYGRANTTRAGKDYHDGTIVYVVQDARGCYDSEGKPRADLTKPGFEMNDINDTVDWIAKQPWCNGKVGLLGASGNGVSPCEGYLTKNPHIVMCSPSISSDYPYYNWGFNNGTRKGLYGWLKNTGVDSAQFPSPTIPQFDLEKYRAIRDEAAKSNPIVLVNSSGWYDIASEPVLDQFHDFAATGKIFANVGAGAHGGNPWPKVGARPKGAVYPPKLFDVLLGKGKVPEKSQLTYYVLGNFRDPSTPGNFVKMTDTWPVPSTPGFWYFHPNGGLSQTEPPDEPEPQKYDYDPNNPAPSIGGNYTYLAPAGPSDERPLLERKDILHFTSEPLTEPVEFIGKIKARLFFSTDVPDTLFVVKFTDIQPDGYEMIVRESAAMARYAKELNGKPAPLQKDTIYQLDIDLWSSAMVLAKGHKLGVIVTSSSKDAFQVHSNSFEPVMDLAKAPVAHQQIHMSKDHPSSLILPVVPLDPEVTEPKPAAPAEKPAAATPPPAAPAP